jgi:hypothetical protein
MRTFYDTDLEQPLSTLSGLINDDKEGRVGQKDRWEPLGQMHGPLSHAKAWTEHHPTSLLLPVTTSRSGIGETSPGLEQHAIAALVRHGRRSLLPRPRLPAPDRHRACPASRAAASSSSVLFNNTQALTEMSSRTFSAATSDVQGTPDDNP